SRTSFCQCVLLFRFNMPPPSVSSTLSLHDALPILDQLINGIGSVETGINQSLNGLYQALSDFSQRTSDTAARQSALSSLSSTARDRKSTRLNSSHVKISYAVFCLKKKKNANNHIQT